jgi:hypothetical protein
MTLNLSYIILNIPTIAMFVIADLRTVFKTLRVGVFAIQLHTKYVSEVPCSKDYLAMATKPKAMTTLLKKCWASQELLIRPKYSYTRVKSAIVSGKTRHKMYQGKTKCYTMNLLHTISKIISEETKCFKIFFLLHEGFLWRVLYT